MHNIRIKLGKITIKHKDHFCILTLPWGCRHVLVCVIRLYDVRFRTFNDIIVMGCVHWTGADLTALSWLLVRAGTIECRAGGCDILTVNAPIRRQTPSAKHLPNVNEVTQQPTLKRTSQTQNVEWRHNHRPPKHDYNGGDKEVSWLVCLPISWHII